MSIDSLSQVTTVSGADNLALSSSSQGGDRRVPVSVLADFIADTITPAVSITQYYSPNVSGGNVLVRPLTGGQNVDLIITPTAGFAAMTVTLPSASSCLDHQLVRMTCTQAVTALSVNGNGAIAVFGAPTTLAANGFFEFQFDAVTTSWYRFG